MTGQSIADGEMKHAGGHEKKSEVVDFMMFCALILNIHTLWMFPSMAFTNGGAFFVVIFIVVNVLLVFPLLHLEIFVGQRHQSGICKIFRSYGWAFEGFGVAIFLLTIVRSSREIDYSYIIMKHIRNVVMNVTDIVSCRSLMEKDLLSKYSCTSLYDDEQCTLLLNSSNYRYMFGSCRNMSRFRRQQSSTKYYYYWSLLAGGEHFEIDRLVYYFILFAMGACISTAGERIIRLLLAIIYTGFSICLVTSVTKFLWIVDVDIILQIFWTVTTPEVLTSFNVYVLALYVALSGGGIMLCGIMSAASFRNKNANTYGLAFAVMLNNIFIAVLSFVFTLGIAAYLRMRRYNGYDDSPRMSAYEYFLATMTDVVLNNSGFKWVIITMIPPAIARLVHFFAPIMVVYGIVRDRAHHQWSRFLCATVTICIVGFLTSSISSYQRDDYYSSHSLEVFLFNYEVSLIAATVTLLVHVYGNREYLVDLNELYPEDGSSSLFIKPTNSIYFTIYKILPFIFGLFGVIETSRAMKGTVGRTYNTSPIFVPLVIITAYFFYNLCTLHKKKKLSMLFSITPEHPSYDRNTDTRLVGIHEGRKNLPTHSMHVNASSMKTAPYSKVANVMDSKITHKKISTVKSVGKVKAESSQMLHKANSTEIQKVSNTRQAKIESKSVVKIDRKQEHKARATNVKQSYEMRTQQVGKTTSNKKPPISHKSALRGTNIGKYVSSHERWKTRSH